MARKRPRALRLLRSFFPTNWEMRRRYRLPSEEAGQAYYIYYPSGLALDRPWPELTFDAEGVAVTAEGYNPVTIAQYALYSHERMSRGVDGSHEAFRAQARYLAERQRADGSYVYDVRFPEYGVEPGFICAMAQGTAASVLVRAFAVTGDARYREAARRAAEPLKKDVSAGGAAFIRGGYAFFEEIASERPCHILNGHLFACFGIYDLARFGLADTQLRSVHERSMETLLRWLPRYEHRGWSYYHLAERDGGARHLAHISYHQLHVAQLYVYAVMTGRADFRATAARWENALRDVRTRASVWFDSAGWLGEIASERVGIRRRGPWRPLHGLAPEGSSP
jgi:heparosan-N-sulfate-glucuronate 5-epimerase